MKLIRIALALLFTLALAAPLTAADDAEAVAALQKLGARFRKNDDGNIKTVLLEGVKLEDADLASLLGLPDLDKLDLTATAAGDEAMKFVVLCKKLRWLELSQSKVTDKGLAVLTVLKGLEYLEVPVATTDAGLKHVGQITSLRTLYTGSTFVTDKGLPHLKKLQNLHTLFISYTRITDGGLKNFTGLRSLRRLHVAETYVTKEGVKRFSQKRPKVAVRY